jgi:hypothetical protein
MFTDGDESCEEPSAGLIGGFGGAALRLSFKPYLKRFPTDVGIVSGMGRNGTIYNQVKHLPEGPEGVTKGRVSIRNIGHGEGIAELKASTYPGPCFCRGKKRSLIRVLSPED